MRREILRATLVAVVLLVVFAGVGRVYVKAREAKDAAEAQRAKSLGRPIPVRTEIVKKKSFETVIGVTAKTIPSQVATVTVGIGRGINSVRTVKNIHVAEGQFVENEQLLCELEDAVYQQAVVQNRATLARARAQLEATENLKTSNVVSQLELRAIQAKLELAKLGLEIAQNDLQSCEVRSPIDGFISSVKITLGENIGSERQILTIKKLDPIRLQVDFPAERMEDVSMGQKASVVLDGFARGMFEATVVQIPPEVTSSTRVLPVVLEMSNAEGRVKAGMSGFARLKAIRSRLTVPVTAVIRRDREAMVFCVENGKAKIRKVTVGNLVDIGVVEILAGLEPGEEVIIYNKKALEDDDPVDTNWRAWSGRD